MQPVILIVFKLVNESIPIIFVILQLTDSFPIIKCSNKLDFSYVTDKIEEIKSAIAELRNFTTIDRDRILNYIERIELPASGNIDVILKSGQSITIKQQKICNHTNGDNAGKKGIQDALYS